MEFDTSIIDYYTNYHEDGRLDRHPVEFAVTAYVLNDTVGAARRILDAATGTGRYALYFAKKGYEVWAEDLVPHNIQILESKLASESSMSITTRVNDARDLSVYTDGFFDSVLYMGPVYHLPHDKILPAIREAVRVLRPGGAIAISFVNKYPGFENDKYAHLIVPHTADEIVEPIRDHFVQEVDIIACDGPMFGELQEIIRTHGLESPMIDRWLGARENAIRSEEWLGRCCHGLITGIKKPVT